MVQNSGDANRWDVEDGLPEVIMCFTCGTAIEEFDAVECPECGEVFCSEACQAKHECEPLIDSAGE